MGNTQDDGTGVANPAGGVKADPATGNEPVTSLERRSFVVQDLAVEEPSDEQRHAGAVPKIVGHAAVFNSLSEDLGGFREKIAPGAFTRTLADSGEPVYALWNHNPDVIIASTLNGSLRLSQDEVGLRAEITPMDTATVRDMVVKPIRDGLVKKMSFGFRVAKGGDEWRTENGQMTRTLKDVDLFDVSPVTYPAYRDTDIAVARAAFRSLVPNETPAPAQESAPAEAGVSADIWRRRVALREREYTKGYPNV